MENNDFWDLTGFVPTFDKLGIKPVCHEWLAAEFVFSAKIPLAFQNLFRFCICTIIISRKMLEFES